MQVKNKDLPLLKIENATVLRDDKRILNNLNLEIKNGEHTAIIGPNGSGKSTLIRLISRQIYPLAKENPVISIFEQERWDVFDLRSHLGIVTDDIQQEFLTDEYVTGYDIVLSGYFASHGIAQHHNVTQAMEESAKQELDFVGASHLSSRCFSTLSSGEARRILIARALVSNPSALLLDEPTTGLDIVARQRFLETLRKISIRGKTIILVTHHIEEILPEINHIILMKNGEIFKDADKQSLLTSQVMSELFGSSVTINQNGLYYNAVV